MPVRAAIQEQLVVLRELSARRILACTAIVLKTQQTADTSVFVHLVILAPIVAYLSILVLLVFRAKTTVHVWRLQPIRATNARVIAHTLVLLVKAVSLSVSRFLARTAVHVLKTHLHAPTTVNVHSVQLDPPVLLESMDARLAHV